MQAVILAAGMGKRLKELTSNNTKCMVKVNGTTIIERLLRILDEKNLSKIILVIGYKGKNLKEYIENLNIATPIEYVTNEIYDKTNNIYSLWLAKNYMIDEDTLLFESDLIFEKQIVDDLTNDSRESLAVVDKFESWMDGTCMVLDSQDNIVNFIPGKYIDYGEKDKYYKTVNIYKFSKRFSKSVYFPFLEAYLKAAGYNEYYESVIKLIVSLGSKEIKAKRLTEEKWYEIDDVQDLDIAETIFCKNAADKYDKISKRYGGYWRYPKMLDFCYLVNKYFPTEKMLDEMKSNFGTLICDYPSGLSVNSLLASKNFGIREDNIVVGNGAAELIKELIECSQYDNVGIIRPTFEEYANRINGKITVFDSGALGFQYTAEDVISFFDNSVIDALVIINPDNPSGNYMCQADIIDLIRWAKKKKISLIIDESFSDFVEYEEGETNSLLSHQYIDMYNKLYIIKSISKSYGVPGLRLGILATSDVEMIRKLKAHMMIWNINSIAEFFMQILGKYVAEYKESLKKIIAERKRFSYLLDEIQGIKVFPSQANYVMCEITKPNLSSCALVGELIKQGLLVKDITSKINLQGEYVRIAIRDQNDDDCLLEVLKQILD